MAELAKVTEPTLHYLTYNECADNKGFGYSLDTKIHGIEDEAAIKRVKEKLLKKQIEKYYKNKEFKSKGIKELRKEEFKYKKEVMGKIYEGLDELEFDVTDLIRGRCFFRRLAQINNAAEAIIHKIKIKAAQGNDVELIQIDNRLKTMTNDIVLKIRIDQTVAEFQLSLRFC